MAAHTGSERVEARNWPPRLAPDHPGNGETPVVAGASGVGDTGLESAGRQHLRAAMRL